MIKDITIGQYFPGDSVIHKMDPRMKIILTVVYIAALFVVKNFLGFLLTGGLLIIIMLISKIPVKTVFRGIKPLLFIIIFTAFFNIFYGTGASVFPGIGWLAWLKWGGLINAAFMVIRIVLLITGTSFMTYTTSPVMLTDALERLISPLKYIKVPVHELAMMMTIAMRFIPTLIDETEKITNAQKARGADFETGNIIRRAKALIPILIPLIVSAFRRAEELADAMECRCYNGGDGRTRYKIYSFSLRDYIAAFVVLAVLISVILTNIFI